MRYLLLFLVFALSQQLQAQAVIQFSGIIVTGDSLTSVPYTNIMVEDTHRGTTSDYFGYFSFVAQEGDTIVFSALGYRESRFIIPDSLDAKRYSLIQVLSKDTIQLDVVNIYPFKSREDFAAAFIKASPPSDLLSARNNLGPSRMLVMMETADRDGFTNHKLNSEEYHNQLYYAGQAPGINLMNPMAWSSFIKALRSGSLKDKQ